ncbi:GT11 [Symbiodinium natans]|uniref:GT11 protein n=1 Tax=Symbiodinium natans TaxID=878477 RepID=A0A812K2K9_9DINO|nr:GT11 [Symbiodinium natans]
MPLALWLRGLASKGPILCGVLVGLYLATHSRHGAATSPEAPWKALADNIPEAPPRGRVQAEEAPSISRTPQREARAFREDAREPQASVILKSPSETPELEATSAPSLGEQEPQECFDTNWALAGFDLQHSKESSALACQKQCQCTEHCTAFTYWQNGDCHAQTDKAPRMRALEAVTGPAFCPGAPAGALLPERAPDLPKMQTAPDRYEGPKVYVYELPERFRNGGKDSACFTVDCVFGGPPMVVQGVEIWASNQFHMPRMLYYRFMNSPRRTKDINEADVFFVPAYSFKPSEETPCADGGDLFNTLFQLNPSLQDPAWGTEKASRHLFADARGWETCNYMWQLAMPFRMFHRVNIELNGLEETGPEGWTDGKPFIWYQFPYPAVYHGHADATPAKLRSRGFARYLWSFTGTGRGIAGHLRSVITEQCNRCTRCGRETNLPEVNGAVTTEEGDSYRRIAEVKLQSTFCLEPPGDTVTRKSLVDSIVLGCIPVVFEHQELDMYEPFLSAEQFAAVALFVPEAEVVGGDAKVSIWAIGTYGGKTTRSINKKMRQLQKLYPEYSELLEALHPRFTQQERWDQVKRIFPKPTPIVDILSRLSEEDVRNKQEALALVAHRLVIGMDDSSEDAVRILLDNIVSNDAEAVAVERKSDLRPP